MIFNPVFSIGLIILITAVFYFSFERSKPTAGELVLVSELCALAIAGRAVFSFVPYFNPVLAIICLTGLSLGVKKGYLCGSLTAFLSNFIFGQGPWTFYQMLSWGLAGAFFGLTGSLGLIKKSRWGAADYLLSCLFAAVLIVFFTGPVTDLSSFFMMGERNFALLKTILAGGFVMNVTLAASTVFAICVIGRPFLRSVERAVDKNENRRFYT